MNSTKIIKQETKKKDEIYNYRKFLEDCCKVITFIVLGVIHLYCTVVHEKKLSKYNGKTVRNLVYNEAIRKRNIIIIWIRVWPQRFVFVLHDDITIIIYNFMKPKKNTLPTNVMTPIDTIILSVTHV